METNVSRHQAGRQGGDAISRRKGEGGEHGHRVSRG
jgi:hypothetical protein